MHNIDSNPPNDAQQLALKTAHIISIVAVFGIMICLIIVTLAMSAVIVRDGNAQLVATTEDTLSKIALGSVFILGVVVSGQQIGSRLLLKFFG